MNTSQILYSIFLIFLLGIAIVIVNHENNNVYPQRVIQTYENEKYGIKIQYQPNWEIMQYPNSANEKTEELVEIHPFGKSKPFISLIVHFLSSENATLKSFTEQEFNQMKQNLIKNK